MDSNRIMILSYQGDHAWYGVDDMAADRDPVWNNVATGSPNYPSLAEIDVGVNYRN